MSEERQRPALPPVGDLYRNRVIPIGFVIGVFSPFLLSIPLFWIAYREHVEWTVRAAAAERQQRIAAVSEGRPMATRADATAKPEAVHSQAGDASGTEARGAGGGGRIALLCFGDAELAGTARGILSEALAREGWTVIELGSADGEADLPRILARHRSAADWLLAVSAEPPRGSAASASLRIDVRRFPDGEKIGAGWFLRLPKPGMADDAQGRARIEQTARSITAALRAPPAGGG